MTDYCPRPRMQSSVATAATARCRRPSTASAPKPTSLHGWPWICSETLSLRFTGRLCNCYTGLEPARSCPSSGNGATVSLFGLLRTGRQPDDGCLKHLVDDHNQLPPHLSCETSVFADEGGPQPEDRASPIRH